MYSEEGDWDQRIKNTGFDIWFNPKSRIIHYGGKSGKDTVNAQKFKSRMIHYGKYHNKFQSKLFNSVIFLHIIIHTIILSLFNIITFGKEKDKLKGYFTSFKKLIKKIIKN